MSTPTALHREQAEQLARRVADEAAAKARLQSPLYGELSDTAAALASVVIAGSGIYLFDAPLYARLILCGLAGAAPLLALRVFRLQGRLAAMRSLLDLREGADRH